MCRAIVAAMIAVFIGRIHAGKLNCLGCHLALGRPAALSYLFYNVTVTVTGLEIHPAVNSARVLTQYPLDITHLFNERTPVHRAPETEAADAVAHRDLICSLFLVLRLHQLPDRQAAFGESLL